MGKPRLVTCHDVMAIQSMQGKITDNRTYLPGRILQKIIVLGLNATPIIVCVSENTKSDIQRILVNKKIKLSTTLQPLNNDFKKLSKNCALKTLNYMNCAYSSPCFVYCYLLITVFQSHLK